MKRRLRCAAVSTLLILCTTSCGTYLKTAGDHANASTALQLFGAEVGVGAVAVGLPLSTCEESCLPGAGNDSAGEVAVSALWGIGFVLLADAALVAFIGFAEALKDGMN